MDSGSLRKRSGDMTHDELLAKIDAELATNYADEGGNFPIGLKALRAVVELAKPDDSDEVYPENKVWKSIIIQAIEKELK